MSSQCRLNGFEFMVKQLEYEVETIKEIVKLKNEGIKASKIAELVGVLSSEIPYATQIKLKKMQEQLAIYKGGMNSC
ncbi:hypothetical protein ACFOUV_02605 [Oceanobacillus longus]|uniref:Uncharacterized protein n=1 Tax=Oceanobacillus longus TaxID=930120 RepID=A0ABV8GVR7_9BACI